MKINYEQRKNSKQGRTGNEESRLNVLICGRKSLKRALTISNYPLDYWGIKTNLLSLSTETKN